MDAFRSLPRPSSAAVLAALLVIAAALRLYGLDDGLWIDEITTWTTYMRLPLSELPTAYESENQHFLFTLLAKLSWLAFGESRWAFRLPAALFGVASIGAMYLFGKEAASQREALFAAALLTFSYHHIWYSQSARGYTGLLFWVLLASWLLLRAMREERTGLWVAYAVVAALGVYTQATMAFALLGHAAIAAVHVARTRRFGAALGFGLGFALTLAVHAPALTAIRTVILEETFSPVAEWKSPWWTLRETLAGLRLNYTAVLAAPLAAVFALGLWSFFRRRPVVLALMVLPAAIGVTTLLVMDHHIWPRFFFFSFGFAALALVRGLISLGRWGTPLLALILIVGAALVPRAYGPKQDFRGALAFVRSRLEPGDRVVAASAASTVATTYLGLDWPRIETVAELEAVQDAAERVWFVYTLPPAFRAYEPKVAERVARDYETVETFWGSLHHGQVIVARYPPASDAP